MPNSIEVQTINHVVVPNSIHIFILVSGTTDPINTFANIQYDLETKKELDFNETLHRSNSYPSKSMYWDDSFYKSLQKLEEDISDFILFDKFGWSGDNCVSNREVSGKYFVRSLFMKNKNTKQGYYEDVIHKPINFHLIGHSHGGNVINEMTKEINALPNWPEKWKVKSIIYLSTPFFKNLHQVKVTKKVFHKEAKVLHLYNDYDLTQNFLADFSLFDLSLIQKILEEKMVLSIRSSNPTNKADEKGKLLQEGLIDKAKKAFETIPTNKFTDIYLSSKEGEILYSRTVRFLDSIESIFYSKHPTNENQIVGIFEALKELNKEIEYKVSDFLKKSIPQGELKTKRQILDDSSYKELITILEEILTGVRKLKNKFNDTIDKVNKGTESYSRLGYLDDLKSSIDLIKTLASFLDINEVSLTSNNPSSFWNILYKVLNNNIDQFDNTYVNPINQFKGTFLEESLKELNITKKDEYDKKTAQAKPTGKLTQAVILSNPTSLYDTQEQMKDIMNPSIFSKRYYTLLSNIRELESNYENNPNQKNFMEIIFVLISHSPIHTLIDKWSKTGLFLAELLMNEKEEESLAKFEQIINKLKRIFNRRFVGNLEAFNMGQLIYFLKNSHSTSRETLHLEVEKFIKESMENK